MTELTDQIYEQILFSRSPTLNPQAVNPDIFDVEGKIIKVPESLYKYHMKTNQRMPEEYLPPEHQRTYGSSFPLPRFPEEGERLGDWSIQLMPEAIGEERYPWVDEEEAEWLERMNISSKGAPKSIVKTATWLPNDEYQPTAVEKLLREHYPDATEADGSPWDFAIRQEPRTKRLMYRDPELKGGDKEYQVLFAPGIQWADVAAELPMLAAEVGGGIVGGVGGSFVAPGPGTVVGGITGEMVMAFGMRLKQLYDFKERGLLDPAKYKDSEDDPRWMNQMVRDSMKYAGFVGAMGVGGTAFFHLLRRVARQTLPQVEWDHDVFAEAYDQVQKEVTPGTPTAEIVSTLTAPQILLHSSVKGAQEQPAAEYWGQLSQLSSRPHKMYDPLREKLATQTRIKETTLREQMDKPGGGTETLEEVMEIGPEQRARRGTNIQEAIETQRLPEVQKLADDISGFEREALEAANDFATGVRPLSELALTTRHSIEAVRNKVDDVLDAKYAQIEKEIQGNPVFDTTSLINWGKKQAGTIKQDILPSLAIEDRRILEDILNLGKKTDPGAGKKIGYPALKRAITNVNGLISKAQGAAKSGASTPELGFLYQLKSQLKGMRDQLIDPKTPWGKGIIERNPKILDELADIEKRYAKFNDNFNRELAGKLTRKVQGSGKVYEIADEKVLDDILLNKDSGSRRKLRAIFNTPEGLEGLEAVRSGIKTMYANQMRQGTGELVALNPAQHQRFFNKYGDAMKEWLRPEDFKKFQNAHSAAIHTKKEIAALERSRKKLIQYPWGSPDLLNEPEILFKEAYQPDRWTRSKNLRQAINELEPTQRDAFIDSFKGMIYRDFIDKTSVKIPKAGGRIEVDINPKAMLEYIDKHRDAMRVWYGDEFIDGLQGWADHVRALAPEGRGVIDVGSAELKAALDLTRAYVGIFTREGRVLTALLRMGRSGKHKYVIEHLVNPKKLRDKVALNKFHTDPRTRAFTRELLTFELEQGMDAQLDPETDKGYLPYQTGTEQELEIYGPEEFGPVSRRTQDYPTPFNTGGPARLIKLNHGY
jgi:hypothetical protein